MTRDEALLWLNDPRENPTERFERIAEWFHRDTGFVRPGKDQPAADARSEADRTMAWQVWHAGKNEEFRDLVRELLEPRRKHRWDHIDGDFACVLCGRTRTQQRSKRLQCRIRPTPPTPGKGEE